MAICQHGVECLDHCWRCCDCSGKDKQNDMCEKCDHAITNEAERITESDAR